MKKICLKLFAMISFSLIMTMSSALALNPADYSKIPKASDDTVVLSYTKEQISDDIVMEEIIEAGALASYTTGITGDYYVTHSYRDSSTNELLAYIRLNCNFQYSDVSDPVYCKFLTEPKTTVDIKNSRVSIDITDETKESNKAGLTTKQRYSKETIKYIFTGALGIEKSRSMWIKCTQSGDVTTSGDKEY